MAKQKLSPSKGMPKHCSFEELYRRIGLLPEKTEFNRRAIRYAREAVHSEKRKRYR